MTKGDIPPQGATELAPVVDEAPPGTWRYLTDLYKLADEGQAATAKRRLLRAKKSGKHWVRKGPDGRDQVLCDPQEPDRLLRRGEATILVGALVGSAEQSEQAEIRILVRDLLKMPRTEELRIPQILHFPLTNAAWDRLIALKKRHPAFTATLLEPEKGRIFFRPEEDGQEFESKWCQIMPLKLLALQNEHPVTRPTPKRPTRKSRKNV